jgi:hypothetical protein
MTATSRFIHSVPCQLPLGLCGSLLLVPAEGCAAMAAHPYEKTELFPCSQAVDASCEKSRSSYSILSGTLPPVVDGDDGRISAEAKPLPPRSESWRLEYATLAKQVASGVFCISLATWWHIEADIDWYLFAAGDSPGAEDDLLSLIVMRDRHSQSFSPTGGSKPRYLSAPTAWSTRPSRRYRRSWNHGRARPQPRALRTREVFELGHCRAASVALHDPLIVAIIPAFAAEYQKPTTTC